jgi:uncharacterized protein YdhG (YjbR/CyaY superfamily)
MGMGTMTIDEFLAGLPSDQGRALSQLRARLRQLVPDADESINYGVPALKLDGRPFVSFGASRTHCSFYVQSPAVLAPFADELTAAGYRLSAGTIGFTPDRPIPDTTLQRIVAARLAEVRRPR